MHGPRAGRGTGDSFGHEVVRGQWSIRNRYERRVPTFRVGRSESLTFAAAALLALPRAQPMAKPMRRRPDCRPPMVRRVSTHRFISFFTTTEFKRVKSLALPPPPLRTSHTIPTADRVRQRQHAPLVRIAVPTIG